MWTMQTETGCSTSPSSTTPSCCCCIVCQSGPASLPGMQRGRSWPASCGAGDRQCFCSKNGYARPKPCSQPALYICTGGVRGLYIMQIRFSVARWPAPTSLNVWSTARKNLQLCWLPGCHCLEVHVPVIPNHLWRIIAHCNTQKQALQLRGYDVCASILSCHAYLICS